MKDLIAAIEADDRPAAGAEQVVERGERRLGVSAALGTHGAPANVVALMETARR
jgi:hypothetical protein